ncbi:MAG TPA: hypothetical protein VHV30_03140, partial [Polyangiaceae bacterium]|nr:hypothetical protein [Polyangiaceae bacterium]
ALRAALASTAAVGLAGLLLFTLARRLLARCAEAPRLGTAVAVIAAVTPLVSAPWQIEGTAVGGSITGAALMLLPLVLASSPPTPPRGRWDLRRSWPGVAFALAIAFGHEPLDGACALAGVAALVVASAEARDDLARAWRDRPTHVLGGALAGCLPFAIALARVRLAGAPVAAAMAQGWSGERALSRAGSPLPFVATEVGVTLLVLAGGGFALAALVSAARPLALALAATCATGFACGWLGAPLGPTRYGAPILAALGCVAALAGASMQAIARAVAGAKIPMARASAALIVVLELTLPVETADDGLARAASRASGAAAAWDDAAWGALPPDTVVLVADAAEYTRARASQVTGGMRGDVTLVPTFLHDARAWRVLAADPSLVPLWRDLELLGAPSEASLSSLATARPVAMAYVPAWGKAIGKHLVPATLYDRFEPEPRGASDRRRGLDAFVPIRERLERGLAGDPELNAAAADLLRARARLATDLASDPELAARTVADLHAFAR